MRCNILLDKLPDHVVCGGSKYYIKTDFRIWIRFANTISELSRHSSDDTAKRLAEVILDVTDEKKTQKVNGTLGELFGEFFKFYSCMDDDDTDSDVKTKHSSKSSKAIYDFVYDSDYIFASFLEVYGIDLECTQMHYHKFMALFKSLPDTCKFSKILQYRSCDTSKMKGEEKRFYSDMKEYYALPDNRTREEKDAELYAEISAMF